MTRGVIYIVLAVTVCATPGQDRAERFRRGKSALNDLSLEVAALQLLFDFNLTQAQMQAIRKLQKETCMDDVPRPDARASEKYRRTLLALREALIEAKDPEHIHALRDRLFELAEQGNPDLDDSIEITEGARRRAPEFFRQLSPRQIATYVAMYPDDHPDPRERVIQLLDEARQADAQKWRLLREDAAAQLGHLVGGLDEDKCVRVSDQVIQLMIQVRALAEEVYIQERPKLEEQARQIVGAISSLEVLRNSVEVALAELLSNPRLPSALRARLRD